MIYFRGPRLGRVCVFAMMLVLSGCAGLEQIVQTPAAVVENVELGNVGVQGMTALFTLKVDNPNAFALAVSGLGYALSLNGRELFQGESDQSISVPANGSGSVTLPITVGFADLMEAVPNLLTSRAVDYEFNGFAKAGPFKIPYRRNGQFDLQSALRLMAPKATPPPA
ncbi:MAG: LEA type 2 family protein [Gammaproteobacteria bacterium]